MAIKKILPILLITVSIFGGENTMAQNTLSAKQQSIAASAAYAALGDQQSLKKALADGINQGASVNELREVLVQSYAYCGFPRSLNALATLMQLAEEKSLDTSAPKSTPLDNALATGTENQTKLVGSEVKGKLFDFAPAIDEYLKSHLFGDIFSRSDIDWQTRELATVAMLAAREGVESQLNAHIQIAKHNGLTDEQIKEVLLIASKARAENILFGMGEKNPYGKYFIGQSYLQPINKEGVPMFNVTFEPKCRNNWHIHHKGGQILIAVSGRGWYQAWGEEARELNPGDVVNIPPETKHWHGAAKDSWFTHIAVEIPSEGGSTEWLEPVADEEYNKLK